jgi:hypothetical protein
LVGLLDWHVGWLGALQLSAESADLPSTSRALGDIGISLSDLCLASSVQAAPTTAATACFDRQAVLIKASSDRTPALPANRLIAAAEILRGTTSTEPVGMVGKEAG